MGFAEKIAAENPEVRIVVLGHIHFTDLRKIEGDRGYANSGTWLRNVKASKDSKECFLKIIPSPLPYVKISKLEGENIALVELKFFRGNFQHRMLKVTL